MNALHVKTVGSGPDLVLLHGWGFNSNIWNGWISELLPHFRITTVDLPGCGYSKFILTMDIEQYNLNYLSDILAAHLPKRVHILGWSLGGLLAIHYCHRYPERVESLNTITCNVKFCQEDSATGISRKQLQNMAEKLIDDREQTLTDFIRLQFFKVPKCKTIMMKVIQESRRQPQPHTTALLAGLNILTTYDATNIIKDISHNQLHIYGKFDRIVPVQAAYQHQSMITTNQQVVIVENSGHMPFLTHTKYCSQILKEYIHGST